MADKQLKIRITGDSKSAQSALKGTANDVGGLKGMMDGASKSIAGQIAGWASVGAAVALAGKAIKETTKFIKDAIAEAAADQKQEALLAGVMKSVGTYSRESFESMKNLSQQMEDVTAFSHDAVIGAEKMLQTFKMAPSDIERTIPLLLDMAAALERSGGQAPSLEQLAIQLGKTYSGESLGMLRRFGGSGGGGYLCRSTGPDEERIRRTDRGCGLSSPTGSD